MTSTRKFLSTVALSVLCSPADAFTVQQYWDFKKTGAATSEITIFLLGAGQALADANAELLNLHRPLFFCAPAHLVLQPENYVAIMEKEPATNKNIYSKNPDVVPIDMVLLFGLETTFPCTK